MELKCNAATLWLRWQPLQVHSQAQLNFARLRRDTWSCCLSRRYWMWTSQSQHSPLPPALWSMSDTETPGYRPQGNQPRHTVLQSSQCQPVSKMSLVCTAEARQSPPGKNVRQNASSQLMLQMSCTERGGTVIYVIMLIKYLIMADLLF